MKRRIAFVLIAAALCLPAAAQETLRLDTLQQDAVQNDPRLKQLQLEASQTKLRLQNLEAEKLPSLTTQGQAQYQSSVLSIPITLPGGLKFPTPSRDTYDLHVDAGEKLLDPSRRPRAALERANLAAAQARIEVTLYGLRQQVNDAFFPAVLFQDQAKQVGTAISDLEARLRDASARVQQGTALPSEAAAIEATLLQRREDADELRADRTAALQRLSDLTGRSIRDTDVLVLPDLSTTVTRARADADTLRARPEYAQFAASEQQLEKQKSVIAASTRPMVSAYARLGYGKPGLNLISNSFQSYWYAGLRFQWTPWTWRTTEREQQALALQQQETAADQAAFSESIRRSIPNDLTTIDRLAGTLSTDDRIIALREQIEHETRLRFDEHVVTASEYVDRSTDLLDARLARALHRAQLAQAEAHLLTTLGLEVH